MGLLADLGPRRARGQRIGARGGVVSYAAASAAIGLALLLSGPRREIAAITGRNLCWFSGTGFMTCVSQIRGTFPTLGAHKALAR